MTTLTVREVQENERKVWDDFVDNSFCGDLLSMWGWGEVKKDQGWKPMHIGVFEGDRLILVALGLLKRASILGNYLYIGHGPVFRTYEDLQKALPHFTEYLKTLRKLHNVFAVEIEPRLGLLDSSETDHSRATENIKRLISPQLPTILAKHGFIRTGRNMQLIYNLYFDLGLTEEQLLAAMKKNTRYNIGLAKRKGVIVKEYKSDYTQITEKVDQLYELMLEMQKRANGYPIRPKSSFHKLMQAFKGTGYISMFEVGAEGDVVAINLSQKMKYWSSSFYSGSNRLHTEKKPMYLLRWQSILWAKQSGSKVYDFWGYVPNSEHHKGYSENKLSFGGVIVKNFGIFALPLSLPRYWVWHVGSYVRRLVYSRH